MRRLRPTRPQVRLNPQAAWEHLSRRNMSQNDLARAAGISTGHMSLLVNGRRSPSPGVRRRLQEVLGVTDFHELFILEEARE
ncbi:MAG: helix-turn-helix transcriptional regulator [Chloroflexota bacterium]|nr:helix-turn-helix transcriptional regulator [Chloroflexota bacterium]